MNQWEVDRNACEAIPVLRQVRRIIAKVLGVELVQVRKSSNFEDTRLAADLIVLRECLPDLRIGVRIRRPGYQEKFPHDVSFRLRRDSGTETEYSKFLRGEMDFFVYGHLNDSGVVHAGFVVDCAALRDQLLTGPTLKHIDKPNSQGGVPDGTYGRYVDTRSMGPGCVAYQWK